MSRGRETSEYHPDQMISRPRPALASMMVFLMLASACSAAASPSPSTAPAVSTAPASSSIDEAAGPGDADPWTANAAEHRGRNGENFEYDCPPGGEAHTVYGSQPYTDDSSVCTAAVHFGAITLADGGTVTIEIHPDWESYEGSDSNGITTLDYGSWPGSFVILSD